jgi:hypothetical protein
VTNEGEREGDEVVMAYHQAGDDVRAAAHHPVPLRALVQFERVSLDARATATVRFRLTSDDLMLVDERGDDRLYHGHHTLVFSRGHGKEVAVEIVV